MWGEGTVLAGRYRLRRRIGGGSMGDVWCALDPVLGREVAVKILLPALLDDAGFAARFQTEARVLAALSHPGIVSVFDYGEADDPRTAFLVMELITGRPLSALLEDGAPLSEATTLAIVAQTLEALQAAHDQGIVHRDVKPANLMLRGDSVVVTDFGVARTADARRLTAADVVLGTAVYAAPEQARHTAVTPAADQYAVGVIAYECLTGAPPFDGGTPLGIMMKHVQEPVPPLPETVSAPVRELVMRALAKEPEARFGSAREMAEAARRIAGGGAGVGVSVGVGAGVTRIGMPEDSFQAGVDVAAVARAGAAEDGWADGDFLSFTVVAREETVAEVGDEDLTADEDEVVPSEEEAPVWASYAVRSQEEGADWASFTVRSLEEELPERAVPQDSFTAGVVGDQASDTESEAEAEAKPKKRRGAVLVGVAAVVAVAGAVALAHPRSRSHTPVASVAATQSQPSASPSASASASAATPTVPHKSGAITNVGDGNAIDVFDTGTSVLTDGARVTVEPPAGRTGQVFQATAEVVGGSTFYQFGDALDTSELLDASASGGDVTLRHCACRTPNQNQPNQDQHQNQPNQNQHQNQPNQNQLWLLSRDKAMPQGAYYLTNHKTGGCLTDAGASRPLIVKPCVAGDKAQQWYLP